MNNNNFSQKENVLLVGVIYGELDEEKVHEHLDELSLLAETAGGHVIKKPSLLFSPIEDWEMDQQKLKLRNKPKLI